MAVLSGLIARVLIPSDGVFDPELSIPMLWQNLLPPALVGFLIAGLFSATMSTADSLLLSASSALSQHIIPSWRNSYGKARIATLCVISLVVVIALTAGKGVLALVVVAWGGMASAVAPLVIIQLLGARVSEKLAVTMMITGFATTLIWRHGLGLHSVIMDLVPGILSGFIIYGINYAARKLKKA
jgi:Na+/proline symporter